MARETAAEKKVREAKERRALRRKERRAAARRAAMQPQGYEVDPSPAHQLEHQIGRLSQRLSELRATADLVRPRKPLGVKQLHRRMVCTVFDNKGIRIGGATYDLQHADDLTLTVSGSDITATISSGDR